MSTYRDLRPKFALLSAAQVVDDVARVTLAHATTLQAGVKSNIEGESYCTKV